MSWKGIVVSVVVINEIFLFLQNLSPWLHHWPAAELLGRVRTCVHVCVNVYVYVCMCV